MKKVRLTTLRVQSFLTSSIGSRLFDDLADQLARGVEIPPARGILLPLT